MKLTCYLLPQICQFGEGLLITGDPSLDDASRFNVYMGHVPSGSSVHSLAHFSQLMNSDRVQYYDWGSAKDNIAHYGQDKPPEIDYKLIGKQSVPIAMFVGRFDNLGDLEDARWARSTILEAGGHICHYQEFDAGHASFMVAKDMSYFQ